MENMLEPTDRELGQPSEWMAGRHDSIRGVVLAGIYPWANSVLSHAGAAFEYPWRTSL